MKKKKILLCWGTRPEALKMASLALRLKSHPRLRPIIILTGQHREMVDQVMRLFRLRADYDLSVMTENQSLASLSERILKRMDSLLVKIKPDCVIVQGDTTTAFLTALSAFYQKIPVGHVEAGLRTDDKYQPFPEEINRRLITRIADFHFAPTAIARKRLLKEGIAPAKIIQTGNTGIDALLLMRRMLQARKKPPLRLPRNKKIVLVTAHRRESFGKPLEQICKAIRNIAAQIPQTQIYYPVHLNPNVEAVARRMLRHNPRIHLIPPVSYDKLAYLMEKSDLILTDSGGIQEEAPSFHKPILVLREVTERPEGVALGFSRVVGRNPQKILQEAKRCLTNPEISRRLKHKSNPYGDGRAAERIIRFLQQNL
jgi:UDP-N-acetylglucosamine 2-epimerase (non-hydrolysing)